MDGPSVTLVPAPDAPPSPAALALVPAAPAPAGARSEDLVDHGNWASNIVEKFNATAQKLCAAQADIQQVQQEQGRCVQQLQKMAAQNDELDAKQQKMIGELQKADKDMHESIRNLMEERLDATKSEVQKAVRKLDETLNPKFDGLERGIQDISGMQQEIQARTLPRWRADVGTEIQGLRNDLAQQQEASAARDDELAAALSKAQAAAKESQAGLEARLLAEIGDLKARLGRAEQAAEALRADHCNTRGSLADLEGRHAREKDVVDARLFDLEGSRDSQMDDRGQGGAAGGQAREGAPAAPLRLILRTRRQSSPASCQQRGGSWKPGPRTWTRGRASCRSISRSRSTRPRLRWTRSWRARWRS
ncbi:unnamed protein product [Prorocentrum cordatum]|uniref:Uncharacterized protein n=1 Tax=Prorocentrum cordatum TaxID=2364126 RepID=A0ABN9U1T4_9DINO|nr:unnamed protein product [Polarella glacialis]